MKDESPQRVGILGAGQLALMLAQASERLDLEVLCAGQDGDCAEQAAPVLQVELNRAAEVAAFAKRADLVTVESENIDASVLHGLELYPNAHAIGIAQDRLLEKRFFGQCGIQVAPFAAVDSLDDLKQALAQIGLPAILKTRRMGYDGKGQVRLQHLEEAAGAWDAVDQVPSILEGMVRFDTEVSMIAVRGRTGDTAFYPLVENFHRDGILRKSIAPYARASELQEQAEAYLRVLLEQLEYVGVLTVEFFVQGERLIANEMAPRVHNSGHWTIEGSVSSQFENHLRAIAGLPLGSTESLPMVMLNCIGWMPPLAETEGCPSLLRHDYGKDPRPGRKVGHLTFPASAEKDIAEWEARLAQHG
ncbi:MAG TPA: 5-(carboxyamino)imidazole ribonucleotide synthase [Acidobacteriaceae bacterium]|jgi:5-(carboxyamino)imidazole ribonucleotide synthase